MPIQKILTPEAVQKILMPEAAQRTPMPEAVQKILMPEAVQKIPMPEAATPQAAAMEAPEAIHPVAVTLQAVMPQAVAIHPVRLFTTSNCTKEISTKNGNLLFYIISLFREPFCGSAINTRVVSKTGNRHRHVLTQEKAYFL